MTKIFALIALMTFANSALADCPRTRGRLICPGDTVVTNDNIVATVQGVNPRRENISVRSNYSGKVYNRSKKSLAIGAGCLGIYCVGDTVVTNDNIVAKVLAVNPYTNNIAVRSNYSGKVYTRSADSLSLGLGCVYDICVGDEVITDDNIVAKVLAVNSYANNIAVRSNYSGKVYTRSLDTLASAEYCDDYGSYHRSLSSYPVFDEALVVDLSFRFSLRRPVQR